MSKSSPPASSIESPAQLNPPTNPLARSKTFSTQFGAAVRWLHIYVSLLGFTALVFFAITGITLNHPTWFGIEAERTRSVEGDLDKAWLNRPLPMSLPSPPTDAGTGEVDYSIHVDKLAVVEKLRDAHRLRGGVSEFRVDDRECTIVFKGPGYFADVIVERDSGHYQLTETSLGAVAIMNDLHKGRDTGPGWSWVIDISALLMVFVSITGIVLIFYVRRKRISGLVTAVVGTILFALLYLWLVP